MRMSTVARPSGFLAVVGVFAIGVLLSGCPAASEKPAKEQSASRDASSPVAKPAGKPAAEAQPKSKIGQLPAAEAKSAGASPSPEKDLSAELEEVAEKPRDLGQPLVDDSGKLVRLDPKQPVWIDSANKHIVMLGEVCKAGYPLEFFATYSNRSYEAVVSINATPSIVHAGLLATGAEPGHPAKFEPEFVAPTGTEVAIEVRWKDEQGKIQSAPAQHWIRNIKTKKELDCNWVFAGSLFVSDETTGKKYYQADSGELICVLSLPTAMLDLPIRSYGAIEARSFEAFEEHLPPSGTPVTILLKPILTGKPVAQKPKEVASPVRAEAEKKAVESAGPWLALVDQGQYARSWETASEFFKNSIDRKSFVKALNASRKPLGEMKSRQLESKQYATSVPGAPDGRYVILQYKTVFANKKSAVETVTPMLDKDKKWKVSGYYVK